MTSFKGGLRGRFLRTIREHREKEEILKNLREKQESGNLSQEFKDWYEWFGVSEGKRDRSGKIIKPSRFQLKKELFKLRAEESGAATWRSRLYAEGISADWVDQYLKVLRWRQEIIKKRLEK